MSLATVIFDFDDTLVQSYPIFLDFEARFLEAMAELGFADREQVREYERALDIAIVTAAGYPALDSFPHALRDTYRHFCEAAGQKPQPAAEIRLEGLGWQVHRTPPPPVPGAWEMLAALEGKVRMLLFSQGDEGSQLWRMEASGFGARFPVCQVVPRKTPEAFRQLLSAHDIDPNRCWMVGNSLKTDVNPALAVGLRAIHFDTHDWVFDYAPPEGEYYRVADLKEIPELILS